MSSSPTPSAPSGSAPNADDHSPDAISTTSDARITVRRESPDDVGFREIFLSIDGEQVAILRPNESFTKQIAPGAHRLRAHNTLFWKNIEIDLQPGEHARFRAVNRAGWGTYSVLAWISAGPLYLTFEREPVD